MIYELIYLLTSSIFIILDLQVHKILSFLITKEKLIQHFLSLSLCFVK